MKLLARIKQWNKSNAGLTLVEIIVTMLILVVIALPILSGFIVAARANAMAKDMAYARDAAENVIEVANSGGVSEEVFATVGWGYNKLSEVERNADTFTYTLTGIRSGTGTYTAKVICNKATYTEANSYELPDMSALDAEETVVIFPESNFYKFNDDGTLDSSSDLHRFDTTAINDFYSDYHDGIIDIYNNVVYASYLEQVKWVEEANKTIVSPTPTLAPPEIPPYLTVIRDDDEALATGEEPIKSYIHRTIDIAVEYSPSTEVGGADGVQATVSTAYVYEMRDGLATGTLEAMINASFTQYRDTTLYDYVSAAELDAAISALVNKLSEPKSYAVAATSTVDTLDNVYMITYPFNAEYGQIINYNTLALTAELKTGVANNYLNDKSVNVFLAIQEDAAYSPNPAAGDSFNITLTNGSIFKLYSQMGFTPTEGSLPSASNEKLYNSKESSSGNILLDVTVKIYNPDNVVDGQELAEVKTTISSKK